MMQGLWRSNGGIQLEQSPTTTLSLTFDVGESTEDRIRRILSENPVVIFSKSSCCLCLVMKSLLSSIGVEPTIIEMDDDEISALSFSGATAIYGSAPTVFVGGVWVGGLERLFSLHLSGHLVPKLVQLGALKEKVV